ncbi:MAG: LLM class F420-dependent oxidoreductase [Polyangiaceae bacterium UTPRO1]|jgi:probable F420-dependent oxidoreductase|nr:LLM class F420-dependent oxidoreductase [Myxococcales bacterium]OQY67522.1 MAG: LLM class F420-dependent oxidoreductase [Polyangiaceae bacterium UTPRO1]
MHFGIMMFAADYAIRPDELAVEAEARGFESVFFPEHTHIPASRRSPYPGGGELPKEYSHTHDLFVTLATAAAATRTIKVGAGICLVVERDPITTAKEVASIDFLSRGRLLFGIGGGWNAEEMENHGTAFATRWKLLRERVLAMKEIWTRDAAEFHGDFVDFDPIWSWPKPVQKPHPPILMGGNTARARQRVVDFCNGWIPIGFDPGQVISGMRDLAERARVAGKRPEDFPVTVFGAPPDPEVLKRLAAAGVERVNLWVPPAPREEVLPILDGYATLAASAR